MLQTRVPISTLNYCRIRLGQDLKSPKVIIARSPESPSSARAFPGIILACRSIGSKPPISKRTFYHVIAVDFLGIFKSCRSRTHSSMGIKRGAINRYNSCINSIRFGGKTPGRTLSQLFKISRQTIRRQCNSSRYLQIWAFSTSRFLSTDKISTVCLSTISKLDAIDLSGTLISRILDSITIFVLT